MTLLTMVKRVARETNENTAITTVEGTLSDWVQRIVDYINEGYKLVFIEAFGNNLTDTSGTWTISSSPYDISSKGIQKIISLYIDNTPITMMDYSEYLRHSKDTNCSGQPSIGSVFQNKLYLDPVPDSSYTVSYSAKASFVALSKNTDSALVDEDVLVSYARFKVFDYESDPRMKSTFETFKLLKSSYLDSCKKFDGLPPMIMPEEAFYYGNAADNTI